MKHELGETARIRERKKEERRHCLPRAVKIKS